MVMDSFTGAEKYVRPFFVGRAADFAAIGREKISHFFKRLTLRIQLVFVNRRALGKCAFTILRSPPNDNTDEGVWQNRDEIGAASMKN